MKRSKHLILVSGVLFLQLISAIGVASAVTYGVEHTKAPEGFVVWGEDLSGLGLEQAYQRLEPKIPREVTYQGTNYPLQISQSQSRLKEWLHEQYEPKSHVWLINVLAYLKDLRPQQLSPERLDPGEIMPQLENLARKINQAGKPAEIRFVNGRFQVQAGSPQISLDVQKSWERLQQGLNSGPVPLQVNAQSLKPEAQDLLQIKDKLGDYTTYFSPNQSARTNNVRLAAKAINGVLLKPGEEFSFNQTVGKRDKAAGYLPASVFVNQHVVLDDGGGICQDSSTLYHAVQQAHLQILERNTHSLPVAYVPEGQDATVAFGLLDFRFRNDTQGYLYIDAQTGKDWLRIRIYGVADPNHPRIAEPDGYPKKPTDEGYTDTK